MSEHISLDAKPPHTDVRNGSDIWNMFGKKFPRSEVVFLCQMCALMCVILACIINISLGHKSDVWLVMLSSCMGIIMPHPRIKARKKVILDQTST